MGLVDFSGFVHSWDLFFVGISGITVDFGICGFSGFVDFLIFFFILGFF